MERQLAGGFQLKVIVVLAGLTTNQHWSIPMTETSRVQALLSRQNNEIDALKARIEALEKALHRISLGSQDSGTTKEALGREARAALGEKKDG